MNLITKILHIFTLLLAIVLFLHIAQTLGWEKFWKGRAAAEAAKTESTRSLAADSLHGIDAMVASVDMEIEAKQRELEGLRGKTEVATAWAASNAFMTEQVSEAVAEQSAGLSSSKRGVAGRYKNVLEGLRQVVSERSDRKATLTGELSDALANLTVARMNYARKHAALLNLELRQHQLQEQHEATMKRLYRFRFLEPDVQAKIGDNGKMIRAAVTSGGEDRITLDRGSDAGVQLYQKYQITRNGNVIAEGNVVNVTNGSAILEVTALPKKRWNMVPAAGDVAMPRRFLATATVTSVSE